MNPVPEDATRLALHASAVAFDGNAVMMLGPSGSGKSSLALQLISLGALLVSDDQLLLTRHGDRILASPPPDTPGLIEARGIGLLTAPRTNRAQLDLIVDLEHPEQERLPPRRTRAILGIDLDLVYGRDLPNLPAAIRHYMTYGRGA